MILLFSGGLDSFCLWHLLGKPPCLYVKLGHRYQDVELAAIKLLQKVAGVDVQFDDRLCLGDLEADDAHIPLRNLYLVMIASQYDAEVAIGALRGEYSTDKDGRFEKLSNALLSHCLGHKIRLLRPASRLTKTGLVREYLRRGGNPDWLRLTVSCYNDGFCGQCQSCFRRWVAMTLNGIHEDYKSNPALMAAEWRDGLKKHGWLGIWRTWPSNLDAALALAKRA